MSREKILQATWELIQAEGIESITARKIASQAGTNLALVNYYFGSKEQLINEVVKQRLQAFREAFEVLDETTLAPMARLRRFLLSYSDVLLKNPELAKRLFSQEDLFASHVEYLAFLKQQGFEKLINTLLEIVGQASREKVLLMIQHLFGAIFIPLVIRRGFNPVISASLIDSPTSLEERIDLFLECYFALFQAKQETE